MAPMEMQSKDEQISALMPLIGIVADVTEIGIHPFHAVGEKYINAVAHGCHALALVIPAFSPDYDLDSLLDRVELGDLIRRLDGLFLPGSASNIEPHHYDGEASTPDTLHDSQRDLTALPLIRAALADGLPPFAVCRRFQDQNVALGGTLHQRIHEIPGMLDRREDKSLPRNQQYALAHPVELSTGGLIAQLTGATEAKVNSLHNQGTDRLADGLIVEAAAPDGLIEAARVRDARSFALGVQWHPEWRVIDDALSRALFTAFGEAARSRAAQRV